MSKQNKKRIEKLRDKYRLIIINDKSFKEVFSYKLNRLNVVSLVGFISIFIVTISYLLIAYTPLKEYVIPDYPKLEERQKIIETVIRTDSLENQLRVYNQQINILKIILNGGKPPQYVQELGDSGTGISAYNLEPSALDSALRGEVQEYEALNLKHQEESFSNTQFSNTFFVPPLKGVISSSYNANKKHFATDIVAAKGNVVHSVLAGTVILNTWTLETGYIIAIQHDNNFVSQYKHNAKLLRKTGDVVQAGEGIAIIGNTGEITTGLHLHFELWHEGKAVNSEEFIVY